MSISKQFIAKPRFGNLTERGLHYKDILTYVTIRSYYNTDIQCSYPTYLTLCERSGLSKKFLAASIKRLKAAGLIDIWKVGTRGRISHRYQYPAIDHWQKISFDIFKASDLTSNEKAILLLFREYASKDLVCVHTISDIALYSGLSYRTICKHYHNLIELGCLAEFEFFDAATKTITKRIVFKDRINWKFENCAKTDGTGRSINQEFDVNVILKNWQISKKAGSGLSN